MAIKWFWYDWHNTVIVWLGLAAWFLSPYVSSASICLDFVVQLALPCLIPIPPEIYYPIYPEHFQAHHMNTSKLQLINPHSFTIEKHKFHLFKALFKQSFIIEPFNPWVYFLNDSIFSSWPKKNLKKPLPRKGSSATTTWRPIPNKKSLSNKKTTLKFMPFHLIQIGFFKGICISCIYSPPRMQSWRIKV